MTPDILQKPDAPTITGFSNAVNKIHYMKYISTQWLARHCSEAPMRASELTLFCAAARVPIACEAQKDRRSQPCAASNPSLQDDHDAFSVRFGAVSVFFLSRSIHYPPPALENR
ncbi:hypothetical protein ACFX5Q_14730 [Mesorhizobium sp. IMUNJ 23033]|uniref:hypothetical protein n=1 Tax=Mesorhizobium sp. IMUNJ 23033 TaxID=3378039 RepID=UPI00384B20AA